MQKKISRIVTAINEVAGSPRAVSRDLERKKVCDNAILKIQSTNRFFLSLFFSLLESIVSCMLLILFLFIYFCSLNC